jgi:hypothetical protein
MVTRLLILSSIALVLASCSVLIDVEGKQCASNDDCVALGAAFAGSVCERNICVKPTDTAGGEAGGGSAMPPDPLMCTASELSTEPLVKFTFAPVYAPDSTPTDAQPFTIKACGQFDFECANPVFGPLEVNAGEPQDFEVKPGFQGFFEIKNRDTLDGLLFLGRPVNEDTLGWNVTMPTRQTVAGLALVTGENIDHDLGLILSVARDCDGLPLEHVTFSSSKPGLGYYFVMNLPNTELTETGPQGAAGFANVPIGTTILTGVHNPSGHALGPVSVRLKPNTVSFAEIWP